MAEIEDRVSKLEKTFARLTGGAIVAGIALLAFFSVTHFHQVPSKVQEFLPDAIEIYVEDQYPGFNEQLQAFLDSARTAASKAEKHTDDAKQTVDQLEALLGRFHEVNISPSYSMWMSKHNTNDHTAEELPLEIFKELCADLDGCLIQLKLKGWNSTDGRLNVGLSKWASVMYDSNTGAWTSNPVIYNSSTCYKSECVYGRDGQHDGIEKNRSQNHLLQEFIQKGKSAACYLTDIEYPDYGESKDSRKGIHLLSATSSYNVSDRRCGITIRD